MNKIYNNLNIENLMKTKWFNQFEESQQEVIKIGLKENVDVSIYAKKEFNWEQMMEILWGLKDNLDVSLYTEPDLSDEQMRENRLKLQKENNNQREKLENEQDI